MLPITSFFGFALLFVLAACNPVDEAFHEAWLGFKAEYDKLYNSFAEEIHRRMIWEDNVRIIIAHNKEADAGLQTYRLGINGYADLTNKEYREKLLGMMEDFSYRDNQKLIDDGELSLVSLEKIPKSVDWRTKGYVTPVKDQQQCGSCWAFSATGAIEGQHFKATKKLVSLSEQNLVDCSTPQGNEGCNGGLMDHAFEYVIKNKGIDTEASYPYEARDGKCRYKPANIGATISSFRNIPSGNETALAAALGTVGPISVAIDASTVSFQFYKSGIYNEKRCSSTQLDHGVLAVGFDVQGNNRYWIVKNSWGAGWGQEGYIWMSKDKNNQCGIATAASYPLI